MLVPHERLYHRTYSRLEGLGQKEKIVACGGEWIIFWGREEE